MSDYDVIRCRLIVIVHIAESVFNLENRGRGILVFVPETVGVVVKHTTFCDII